MVQDRLRQVLQAIWEPEFRECSYGFRPGRSAHDALRRLAQIISVDRTQWVVEADIKGFFDHVSHAHMVRFLEQRIADPNFLRLIQRFLKAGVLEDGTFHASEEGTPQGGLVSPVMSNIYLHYVLDLWFEKRYARGCRGQASLVRYADDFGATRGRTRIYQGNLRSGVLPPVPYRAVRWGRPRGAKRSGHCSLRLISGQPIREERLRLPASRRSGAGVEGYGQQM